MIYRRLIRPILFCLDPEDAHHLGLGFLKFASKLPPLRGVLSWLYKHHPKSLAQEIWGLHFPCPIGLAAGFDKNAHAVPALSALGFGFVEVGAISAEGRDGNPRPRIFRLKEDRGLINRMGLPNAGAEATAAELAKIKSHPVPIFGNIVKTADLEGDAATMAADFVATLEKVLPYVDGFTVNISCPASPDLKAFNQQDAMFELLEALKAARDEGVENGDGRFRPLILKVAPDLDEAENEVIIAACKKGLADGLVLTNTTTQRPATLQSNAEIIGERGGLSGAPLFPISKNIVSEFAQRLNGQTPIIAVGGISSPEDAKAMLDAGASLVEVYTGFVYEGPDLMKRVNKFLASQNH